MTAQKDSLILNTIEDGILKVVLNKPTKKNALSLPMYKELTILLNESAKNPKVLIFALTGNGDFFSSGNDFGVFLGTQDSFTTLDDVTLTIKNFVDALILYPKLLIAVVNGPAIGIGSTILGIFDLVYASEKAYFQLPFSNLGLVAEGCSSYTYPRLLGHSKAGEMLYLGYKMRAHEAKQYGLVSEVYNHDSLEEVWKYLNRVSKLSSESIIATKRLVRKWKKETLLEVNAEEIAEVKRRCESPDMTERLLALFSRKNKL